MDLIYSVICIPCSGSPSGCYNISPVPCGDQEPTSSWKSATMQRDLDTEPEVLTWSPGFVSVEWFHIG